MTSQRFPSAALCLAGALLCGNALAQSHLVFVNGQRMNDAQVAALAQRQCAAIPDGAYWLNLRSGAWGYAGNPRAQGVLGEACGSARHAGTNRDGTHGPFVTMRRAEEFAASQRQRGQRAVSFHNGDGYYVRVSP